MPPVTSRDLSALRPSAWPTSSSPTPRSRTSPTSLLVEGLSISRFDSLHLGICVDTSAIASRISGSSGPSGAVTKWRASLRDHRRDRAFHVRVHLPGWMELEGKGSPDWVRSLNGTPEGCVGVARRASCPDRIVHVHPTRLCALACGRHCYSGVGAAAGRRRWRPRSSCGRSTCCAPRATRRSACRRRAAPLRADPRVIAQRAGPRLPRDAHHQRLREPRRGLTTFVPLLDRRRRELRRAGAATHRRDPRQARRVRTSVGHRAADSPRSARPVAAAILADPRGQSGVAGPGWTNVVALGARAVQIRPVAAAAARARSATPRSTPRPTGPPLQWWRSPWRRRCRRSPRAHRPGARPRTLWAQTWAYGGLLAGDCHRRGGRPAIPLADLVNPIVITDAGRLKPSPTTSRRASTSRRSTR